MASLAPVTFVTVAEAAALLARGRIVAFPTETVYGLGAHAFDQAAVVHVFETKGRPKFDPLIVHVDSVERAWSLTRCVPEVAQRLAERFWPGPLTMVLEKDPRVPDIVTAGLDTVALRVPSHPTALALLQAFGGPIAAPSANRFGRVSPTSAQHVLDDLGGESISVLDGGICQAGIESTIVACFGPKPRLLRSGATSLESLKEVLGTLSIDTAPTPRPEAPGQLATHYAPKTPLILDDSGLVSRERSGRWGLLRFQSGPDSESYAAVETLSPTGDLREAAASLFAALRRLDASSLDGIVAERVPEQGLGRAINDRLQRASHD